MDMNKSFILKTKKPSWKVIDAEGQVLGRLASKIADILRGKDKPEYTPSVDSGDYVIVINADKVVLTGNKMESKVYARYTGWIGGYKTTTPQELINKNKTEEIIEMAVKGMLPKNKLNRQVIKKLKVYVGTEHPHKAQVNTK